MRGDNASASRAHRALQTTQIVSDFRGSSTEVQYSTSSVRGTLSLRRRVTRVRAVGGVGAGSVRTIEQARERRGG